MLHANCWMICQDLLKVNKISLLAALGTSSRYSGILERKRCSPSAQLGGAGVIGQHIVKEDTNMQHFAIVDAGKEFHIVPLTSAALSYAVQCRGKLIYSRYNLAKSAAKRMEETLERRKKRAF